jgi:apolipoprotein D and lipocalin family protein
LGRIIAALLVLGLAACASPQYRDRAVPLETVPSVDLSRYAGLWYEVARFPVWFQEGCVGVTADYTLRDDGRVDVLNACSEGSLDGPREEIRGVARAADATGARLKVRFPPAPFEGDYWIVYLDPDYTTAAVATPSGSAGWILSRTPQIAPEALEAARAALARGGYDLARLTPTPQPGAAP